PWLPLVDLSHPQLTGREELAQTLALGEARLPFDLQRVPLLRLLLLRLAETDHLLLVSMHHVISDGWSMGVLVREIAALHQAFAQGQPSPLPELPVQYADFAVWQRGWLQGGELEAQTAYWTGRLAGAPQVLDLPTDRPRPAVQTFRGAVRPVALPLALSAAVGALCAEERVTPFMALLSAWALLLGRHAGQDDVLMGAPVAGRNRQEIEGLIGFFVNTLVLRADFSGSPSFSTVLERVREEALGAFSHQDLPFERLVDAVVTGRDGSRPPLVQALFDWQSAPMGGMEKLEIPGLTFRPVELDLRSSRVELSLHLAEGPAGPAGPAEITGSLEFNTDLFDGATAERLLSRFAVLLAAATADPRQPAAGLPLLLPAERQQLLEWGGTAGEPAAETLHGRFAEQARERPDAVAVVCAGESLTYGELNRRANQLARHLRALGAGTDERIGLCADRSLEMLIGLLGILKAGAAYVPLDPRYPADRLAYTLEDAGVRLLAGTESAMTELPAGATPILLDRDAILLAALPAEDLDDWDDRSDGASLAYVIYTSGSTGRPKGAMLTHGHAVRLFDATHPWFSFGAADVWTLFHSHAFDFSVWEIWGALLYGGRLVVVPYLVSRSPEDFHDLLARERVTVLTQTPSAFAQLQRTGEEPGRAGLGDLRWVIFGGEALDPQGLAPWLDRYGDETPFFFNDTATTE